MRFDKLVQQALYKQMDMPRMKTLPKKVVRFAKSGSDNKAISSMPSVNQVVKKDMKVEWSEQPTQTQNGRQRRPYVIGVVGGTNSGKTSVCKKIISEVTKP